MKLIDKEITIEELNEMSKKLFGVFVKAVVDIEQEIMVVDAELHADEELFLLDNGSNQENLWGINIYPEMSRDSRIEFDSMINLRPSQGNMSRSVEDQNIRQRILQITSRLIKDVAPETSEGSLV